MPDLGWPAAVLCVTVLAAAATSAGRVIVGLLFGRRVHYDVDITHALMGVSMAGMFVADLRFLSATLWKAIFAAVIALYAIRAIAGPQNRNNPQRGLLSQTGHLLSVAAMLYMLQTVPSAATGSMNAPDMPMQMAGIRMGAHLQALSILIAALLVGHAVLTVNRARRVSQANFSAGPDEPPLAPRAAAASEALMCTVMIVMLVATG